MIRVLSMSAGDLYLYPDGTYEFTAPDFDKEMVEELFDMIESYEEEIKRLRSIKVTTAIRNLFPR